MFYYSPSTRGFYDPETHGDSIPADAVQVTPEQRAALLFGQTQGQLIVPDADGRPVLADPPVPTLDEARAVAVARINFEAGAAREPHITVTAGQSATYLSKQIEAERYRDRQGGPYPYLEAEAAATGSTVEDVAALVLATAEAWTALNARIEGVRRGALVAVERAADVAEVDAVFPIAWPQAPA